MRRAFDRHGAADVDVGRVDLALGEAQMREQVEARRGEIGRVDTELVTQEIGAQRPLVEDELDVEGGRQRLFHLLDRFRGKAFGLQRGVIDRRRLLEHAVADRISDDLGDLAVVIAEHAQRFRHRAVDDLEVAAAGKLLELHQREVGLDAGGVAIHHQADGAGRRHHARLRIAIAMRFAERQRAIPGKLGMLASCWSGMALWSSGTGGCRHLLVAGALAVSRAAMVAHHAQHHVAVLGKPRERAQARQPFRRRWRRRRRS
jgi:hypothetical protein